MHAAGIIAEYNPFHEGHRYLLETARKNGADVILIAMSGNFVQRGEPALLPKDYRARAALSMGADIVAEIPIPWAMAGAETFAKGGVFLLSSLGCSELWFGSECGEACSLLEAAEVLESYPFKLALHKELEKGISFAAAREKALENVSGSQLSLLLQKPNNTLGIEYCRAILSQGLSMAPRSILRQGAEHDSLTIINRLASAKALREKISELPDFSPLLSDEEWLRSLPAPSLAEIRRAEERGQCPARISRIETAILSSLRKMKKEDFAKLPDVSEGLENRIYAVVRQASSLKSLLAFIKTKRYSYARLRRIILSAYLGLTREDAESFPPYLRILGFTQKGEEYLRNGIRNGETSLPVLTTSSELKALTGFSAHILQLEDQSSDLYALSLPFSPPCGQEFRHKLIKL